MPEVIIILGLGFALVAFGAWGVAQKHGADCDRCLKGESHER